MTENLISGRGLDILDQHIAIQVGNPPHKGIDRGTNQIFLIQLVRKKSYRDVVTLNEGELMQNQVLSYFQSTHRAHVR